MKSLLPLSRQIVRWLRLLGSTTRTECRVFSIGNSYEGRPLVVIRVSYRYVHSLHQIASNASYKCKRKIRKCSNKQNLGLCFVHVFIDMPYLCFPVMERSLQLSIWCSVIAHVVFRWLLSFLCSADRSAVLPRRSRSYGLTLASTPESGSHRQRLCTS